MYMNRLTKEDEIKIIERKGSGNTLKSIKLEFGIKSDKTIYDVLKRGGRDKVIPNKKYEINEEYFSNIDSQDKAYWLGFLYADAHHSGPGMLE